VRWLDRLGVLDTRFMGHFMARDYVTIREEQRDGQPVWTETSVGKALLKSAPARVTRTDGAHRIMGAAWGAPDRRYRGRSRQWAVDPGYDQRGTRVRLRLEVLVRSLARRDPGEHSVTSRATNVAGDVQPAMTDPRIANKRTYSESNGQITRRVQLA